MGTLKIPTNLSSEVMEELDEAIRYAMSGQHDPERMRLAAERMDRTRETIRQRTGIQDFAVPTLRELRDP